MTGLEVELIGFFPEIESVYRHQQQADRSYHTEGCRHS